MTAMSARSASEHDTADLAIIRLPGSARTFEVRDVLRGLGLRWDPATHAWHGSLPAPNREFLARELGLHPQLVAPIERFADEKCPEGPRGPPGPRPSIAARNAPRVAHDGSRTRTEARIAFPVDDLDPAPPFLGRFTLHDITSGLPDDSREADERRAERELRELRGRVKAAWSALAALPGALDRMQSDPRRLAAFYHLWGIDQDRFQEGTRGTLQAGDDHVAGRLSLTVL